MNFLRKLAGVIIAFSLPYTSSANNIQDHSFQELGHSQLQTSDGEFATLLMTGNFDQLLEQGKAKRKALDESEISKESRARFLNNLSIYLAQADQPDEALLANGAAQKLLESISPFHLDLYHVMMAKGYILVFEDVHDEAEDALRHAQHIAHRNQGVHTINQLPALRLLTEVQTSKFRRKDADQTQRFLLRVNEQAYGAASEEMIPSLTEVGYYFAKRGRTMPSGNSRTTSVFLVGRNRSIDLDTSDVDTAYRSRIFREAEMAFERSIEIIQDKYGTTDLRLVEPLKGLSKTKFFEGYARTHAEKPMELMADIVQQNPGADTADKARALIDLADLYIKTEDPRATETYGKAWSLLQDEAHEELRYEMFGRPVRLLPEANFRPTLSRYPVSTEPNQQLFVDLDFTVSANGRVRGANVTESNVPLRDQKSLRLAVQLMKYRPRMIDGELVDTEGLSLHQTFSVRTTTPEFKAKVEIAP